MTSSLSWTQWVIGGHGLLETLLSIWHCMQHIIPKTGQLKWAEQSIWLWLSPKPRLIHSSSQRSLHHSQQRRNRLIFIRSIAWRYGIALTEVILLFLNRWKSKGDSVAQHVKSQTLKLLGAAGWIVLIFVHCYAVFSTQWWMEYFDDVRAREKGLEPHSSWNCVSN